MKKNPRIGVIILLSIGSLLLIAGVVWFLYNLHFVDTAEMTQGTVIELIRKGKGGYSPTIEFIDNTGMLHTFTSRSSQSPAIAQVGEAVPILYLASDPSRAILFSFVSLWFGPLMLYIAGLINILLAIIFWYTIYKKTQLAKKQAV